MKIEGSQSEVEAFIAQARDQIDANIRTSPDAVRDLFGITILERAESRPPSEDCHQYIFGELGTNEVYQRMFRTHREIDVLSEQRRTGDIVIYDDGEGIAHVGRVGGNGRDVIFKWGPDGHVYQHAPLMIPNLLGNNIRIFRPISSK